MLFAYTLTLFVYTFKLKTHICSAPFEQVVRIFGFITYTECPSYFLSPNFQTSHSYPIYSILEMRKTLGFFLKPVSHTHKLELRVSSVHLFGELIAERTELAICRRLSYTSLPNS